jgi:hypothetical protein
MAGALQNATNDVRYATLWRQDDLGSSSTNFLSTVLSVR